MAIRSRKYGWYVLGLLASLNFVNYATRNVVVTMYPDLRAVFDFDNTQLGWMTSSFMFAHAAMNLPFGWLADRLDRRRVLAVGGLIWSVANLAVVFADGFGFLLAGRIVAGIGTAACVPIANALLSDVFPDERKARTIAVLNLGLFLGGGAGIVLGNIPGFPWAFLAVAVPGLVVSALVAVVDVPPKRQAVLAAPQDMGLGSLVRGAREVLSIGTMRWMIAGAVGASFAAGGYLAWFADFLDRAKGFDPEEAMMILGGLGLTGGLAGVLAGGAVADRLMKTRSHGRLLAIAIGFSLAAPMALVAIYAPRGPVFYAGSWLLMFFINWYHGPMAAAVDDLVDDRRAALAQATFIFLMHLLGTASAPVLVGGLVDLSDVQTALLAPTGAVLLAAICFGVGCLRVRDDAQETC
ncbi:MAG: MFS transporter [Deltaproteobacteria bacterium]|nr:MFS transporter [Deltaproteobacteria bacterium]